MTARRDKVLAWTRSTVRDLRPYYKAPVEGDPLRLDQNTNLYGPNPVLAQVAASLAESTDVTLYPSRDADGLLDALARFHGLSPDHFVVGNGSDEMLDLITKGFTEPGATLTSPWPSYSLYPFYAKLQELRMRRVPLDGAGLDVDAVLAEPAAVTVLASPNNPTGKAFRATDIEAILAGASGIVVVDEAYIEYAGTEKSFLPRVDDHDNLLVMRTFSKAFALAGLRIGYLAGNPDLIERLRLVKPPFNLSTWSEQVAIAAIEASAWVDGVVADTIAARGHLSQALKGRGLRPHASDANFILCDAQDPSAMWAHLKSKGILVRHFPGVEGLEQNIRFTVGRPSHNERLLAALEDA